MNELENLFGKSNFANGQQLDHAFLALTLYLHFENLLFIANWGNTNQQEKTLNKILVLTDHVTNSANHATRKRSHDYTLKNI